MIDRHRADDTVALPNDPPQPLSALHPAAAPVTLTVAHTRFCHGLGLSIPSTQRKRYNTLPSRSADDEILRERRLEVS